METIKKYKQELQASIISDLVSFRSWFNRQPGWFKVIMYSSFSIFLGLLQRDLRDGYFDWKDYALVLITPLNNIIAYLVLHEKKK